MDSETMAVVVEIEDDYPVVDAKWACPTCGERRMDYLVWQTEYSIEDEGDEVVRCATCGAVYAL